MKMDKPFLLVIEVTSGINSHSVYDTFEQAKTAKNKAIKEEQVPLCIFDLSERKFKWENRGFPDYGETIINSAIQLYLK